MSSEERNTILQMLSEGKVTPQEAGDLLDALGSAAQDRGDEPAYAGGSQDRSSRRGPGYAAAMIHGRSQHPELRSRNLMIRITENGETRTKVHIPLGLALATGKFIPKKAHDYLERYGLNLRDILDDVAADLGRTGEIVDVNDGENRVQIVVT